MAEEVLLFRTWSSIFAIRIVWALKLKNVPYDTIFEDLTNKSPLLLQYNPILKKVPVLVHDGKSIAESLVILEYIEETWKQNPLLPEDPHDRATARFWAKFADDQVFPPIKDALYSEGKEQEEAIVKAKECLKYLEEELKGKKFFGGDQIGFADIALGWLAHHLKVIEKIANMELIADDEFPSLSQWQKTFADAHVIKENWPSADEIFIKYLAFREHELANKLKQAP